MTTPFELPGFEPVRRIGGGGFGDVWLCTQTSIGREVAIKVGHSPLQDETVQIRFDRECKALGRLSGHPNIVDVFTAGTLKDGRPYLVLEYIDGGTLWQRLKRAPLTDGELITIGKELAAALDSAHGAGILHRDLKPENILIRSTGGAVLGDFGIARLQDGANTTSTSITASVAYAAPEILSGKPATASTDLYGIGVCLLAATVRSVPFVQKSDESIQPILKRVLSDRHPRLTDYGVSSELAALLDHLLEKSPSNRPESAADVLARFNELHARISGVVTVLPYESSNPGAQRLPTSGQFTDSGGVPALKFDTGPTAVAGPLAQEPKARGLPAIEELPSDPSTDIRAFLIAYTATVVIGGILLALFL